MTDFEPVAARPEWREVWLDNARSIARRSLCDNSKVAAVITSADNQYSWVGYNGPPRGFPHRGRPCTEWCPRAMRSEGSGTTDYSACESLHAEDNVLLRADLQLAKGGAIYITRAPCINCARKIANSGLKYVHFDLAEDDDMDRAQRVGQYLRLVGLEVCSDGFFEELF